MMSRAQRAFELHVKLYILDSLTVMLLKHVPGLHSTGRKRREPFDKAAPSQRGELATEKRALMQQMGGSEKREYARLIEEWARRPSL